MWRLFITLIFLITTFTFITSAHSRVPANDTNISTCPEDAQSNFATIYEPIYNRELLFSCRLKDKNEYVKVEGSRKIFASAYKIENKLYLKDLNIFEDNKLVEFRKYSMDQVLQKWEINNRDETPYFIYTAAAQKLEEFDLETKEIRRQCFFDKELNAFVDIHNTKSNVIIANNIKLEDGEIVHETHISKKDKPEKFFHQLTRKVKSKDINIEICLKEEVARNFFQGTLKFINQDYTLTEGQTLSVQSLVELIEKEDQEIIDFLNSLGPQ